VVSNIKKRNDVYGISDFDSIENLVKELDCTFQVSPNFLLFITYSTSNF
jgi:hypothetical protein